MSVRHVLVIGAQRCGTSAVRRVLQEHPEVAVALPLRPEPKYFVCEESAVLDVDEYRRRFFSHARDGQVCVDKSTSYLEVPRAAHRAACVVPDARIVVQLRDPVERAVSNWRFSTAQGFETRGLAEALRSDLAGSAPAGPGEVSVSPFAYVARGRYAEQLRVWFDAFPQRVRVQFLEEFRVDRQVLRDLFDFVGVDPAVEPASWRRPENASEGPAPILPEDVGRALREHYASADDELSRLLGRELPWRRLATV